MKLESGLTKDGQMKRARFTEEQIAKRAAVAHLTAVMGLSERRACTIVGADRRMIRHD
jgi:hypothetical protein